MHSYSIRGNSRAVQIREEQVMAPSADSALIFCHKSAFAKLDCASTDHSRRWEKGILGCVACVNQDDTVGPAHVCMFGNYRVAKEVI